MIDLDNNVKYIKGVGPNRVESLNKLGIFTLKDLITYYPRDYEDRSKPKKIIDAIDGEDMLIEAIVVSRIVELKIRKNMTMYKLTVRDDTGVCNITWFNQPYLKKQFIYGEKYSFFGKVVLGLVGSLLYFSHATLTSPISSVCPSTPFFTPERSRTFRRYV